MTFEGGWLDPFMTSTYPDVEVRLGRDADRFVGQPGDDLVHGQLLDRRRLDEQGPGLRAAHLPRRRRRHGQVDRRRRCAAVSQGRADPGRQGRAGRGQRLRPTGLGLHARLRGRPEGVPGRLHRPGPGQDLRRRPGRGRDQGGHRRRRSASNRPSSARRGPVRLAGPASADPGGPGMAASDGRQPGLRRERVDRRRSPATR